MFRLLVLVLLAASSKFAVAENASVKVGDFQRDFTQIVVEYAVKYEKAENDLQRSALVTERFERFRKLKGDPRKVKDWYGVLEKMGTTSDGKAYIVVRVYRGISLSTWNNSFSDMNDKTLIPQSSNVYRVLSSMKVGNGVKFSGRMKRTTNPTERGGMVEPNFLFQFSNIEKFSDSASFN